MNFLITENQFKLIISEGPKSKLQDSLKIMNSFVFDLINRVKKKYGLNLKLMSTWGTSVAGLVMPLDNYIKTGNFNLTESETALILLGVAAIIYFDNKSLISKIINKIKEEKLEEPFQRVLGKGMELRKAFLGFLSSLSISVTSFSELVSYAFLIPIIGDIQNLIVKSEQWMNTAGNISERLFASGVVLVGSEILGELIKSIARRFKER